MLRPTYDIFNPKNVGLPCVDDPRFGLKMASASRAPAADRRTLKHSDRDCKARWDPKRVGYGRTLDNTSRAGVDQNKKIAVLFRRNVETNRFLYASVFSAGEG